MFKKPIVSILLLLVISVPASATTVDFSTLTGSNDDPLTIYSENGFIVTNTSNFLVGTVVGIGNPAPSIFAEGIANVTSGTGSFDLTTTGGEDFSLVSFDFLPDNIANYTVMGSLHGAPVFDVSGTSSSSSFVTLTLGTSADIVDLVSFSFLGTEASYGVDNIVANAIPSTAPEPSAAILMLTGIGLLGLMMMMRKRVARGLPQAS
jgi:hypothetical protein